MSKNLILHTDPESILDITEPRNREELYKSLRELDQRLLSDFELRKYFDTLKLAMGAFVQKITVLEASILNVRREQQAAESRMEAMYLKAQLEIQELRSEIHEMKWSKNRINQIVKVAKALQGNAYAPYAVKSMVDGVMRPSLVKNEKTQDSKLPDDFTKRLDFAKENGFKWNQNNRVPSKKSKQIKLLEEWEDQFCKVEELTIQQVLDKKFILSIGHGAVAGALMFLERELGGGPLEERKTHSIYNCYQRAIKLYKSRPILLPETTCKIDLKTLVFDGFMHLPIEEREALAKRFEKRALTSVEEGVLFIKKIVSKELLPSFIEYSGDDLTETDKMYSIQSGKYDEKIIEHMNRLVK